MKIFAPSRLAVLVVVAALGFTSPLLAGKPGGKYSQSSAQQSFSQSYDQSFGQQRLKKNYPQQSSGQSYQSQSGKVQKQGSFQSPNQFNSNQSYPQNGGKWQPVKKQRPMPKLGLNSQFGWNKGVQGEHITAVSYGSQAAQLGLQPGDTILAVNGLPLRTADCWQTQLGRAREHDGWVTLKIHDSWTGNTAYRSANLH